MAIQVDSVRPVYSEGQSMVPSLMPSMTSCGSIPSTVQPTDWAVPSTSFIVPENSLAMERGAITRAAAIISSMEMLPLCWMFFTFLRSLGGSFKALMIRAAAEGTTEQLPWQCRLRFSWATSPVAQPWGQGSWWLQLRHQQPSGRHTSPRWGQTWVPWRENANIRFSRVQVVDEGNFNFPTTTGLHQTRVLAAAVSGRSPM